MNLPAPNLVTPITPTLTGQRPILMGRTGGTLGRTILIQPTPPEEPRCLGRYNRVAQRCSCEVEPECRRYSR